MFIKTNKKESKQTPPQTDPSSKLLRNFKVNETVTDNRDISKEKKFGCKPLLDSQISSTLQPKMSTIKL